MTPASSQVALTRPRILYVVNVSWFFLSHRLPLAQAAMQAGYEVHVATRVASAEDASQIKAAGLELHDVPIGRGDTGPIHDLRSLVALITLYRRLKPDLVHLVAMKAVVFGGLAARLLRVPGTVIAVVGLGGGFAVRGTLSKLRRRLLVVLLRAAIPRRGARVIFQNDDDLRQLVSHRVIPASIARLVPGSGVDPEKFSTTPEPPEPLQVVLPARMLREKGVLVFIAAARLLQSRFPDARFLLAGDVDPANSGSLTRQQLESATRDTRVAWLGHVSDMASLMRSAHVVCLPTWYGEGVPKALIEGAAVGRPLVTTNIPGCRDICIDGLNGRLVPPNDPEALAAAFAGLLADPTLRRTMGAAGRAKVMQEFTLERVTDATLAVYRELLAPGS